MLATHHDAIERLQTALDQYLAVIYNPSTPSSESLTSIPDDQFNGGCITIEDTNTTDPPALTEEQIRAATGITTHGLTAVEGLVTVCDNPDIKATHAVISYVPPGPTATAGTIYVLDATNGAVLDKRPLTLG